MQVYQFPTPVERAAIRSNIVAYAAGRIDRQRMMDNVSDILGKFRVKEMAVGEFRVKAMPPITTSMGTFSGILILANRRVHNGKCPACRGAGKGYLAGEAPVIKVCCLDCGCIFEEVVPDEKAGKGS